MAKRLSNDSPISSILTEIIKSNKLESGLNQVSVEAAWRKIMGNGVNTYTRHIILKNTTIYIELTSAVLREELSYGKDKIIKIINDELGRDVITAVVLR